MHSSYGLVTLIDLPELIGMGQVGTEVGGGGDVVEDTDGAKLSKRVSEAGAQGLIRLNLPEDRSGLVALFERLKAAGALS